MGWYLFGTIVPMIVGFIRTPVFTRHFTPEDFGYLGIVTITFSYVAVFIYSWLSGCLWRYYNSYKEKKNLPNLYSNMFLIFTGASLVMLIITVLWYMLADHVLVRKLILLSFFQFSVREIIGLLLIVSRLEGRTLRYNTIHSLRAVLSFAMMYYLAFGLKADIASMVTGTIVVDMAALLFLVLSNNERIKISFGLISKDTLNILIRFGSLGLLTNFCFLIISSGDRYIIALFGDMSAVGIYNQVYNICQLSVVALVTVFFNTINPKLNRELEINFGEANHLISRYIYVYLLFGLPLVTYLSLFSRQISDLLLGYEFRGGYVVMPFVFTGAFLYGLFLFIEIKFKFADKLRNLATGVILAGIINVGLNFMLIPLYGYTAAGFTTLAAYLFLVVYFFVQDGAGYFSDPRYLRATLCFLFILAIQILLDLFLRKYYDLNIFQTLMEVVLFTAIYLFVFRRKILQSNIPF